MAAGRRRSRDARRRRLGQNFLRPERAERFVASADLAPGDLVVEIGPGSGALTHALLRRGVHVVAIEADRSLAARLRRGAVPAAAGRLRVVASDFLYASLPSRPFRVLGSLPFGRTTAILGRLLDDPELPLERADLIVQWEVARKRAALPPSTSRSVAWAPWWDFRLGPRIPAAAFRPAPRVDAGVLVVTRRDPPLLPRSMARRYGGFVRAHWPFPACGARTRAQPDGLRPDRSGARRSRS